jgi:hypothetical protein
MVWVQHHFLPPSGGIAELLDATTDAEERTEDDEKTVISFGSEEKGKEILFDWGGNRKWAKK